jgi:hypothetical protein
MEQVELCQGKEMEEGQKDSQSTARPILQVHHPALDHLQQEIPVEQDAQGKSSTAWGARAARTMSNGQWPCVVSPSLLVQMPSQNIQREDRQK